MSRTRRRPATATPRGSVPVFAALGDKTRLALLTKLSRGPHLSIARLTAGSSLTRQAITKHLRVMESAGLVRRTQQGRESAWQLEQRRLADARRHLQSISTQWDDTLDRLRRFVER
jgi:DNA-binding transcriptional ArsR family regulator